MRNNFFSIGQEVVIRGYGETCLGKIRNITEKYIYVTYLDSYYNDMREKTFFNQGNHSQENQNGKTRSRHISAIEGVTARDYVEKANRAKNKLNELIFYMDNPGLTENMIDALLAFVKTDLQKFR